MAEIKILVVEDSPTHLRMIKDILVGAKYKVVIAVDGEEALEKALTEKPDLMVLDIILPKKNGFQVCRQLKTSPDTKNIKILMLTSKTQDSDRFWGIKQGADGYMTKPFEEKDLLKNVLDILKGNKVAPSFNS